ncbi:hypothetical protein [Microbulbifer discodermiae]|uniref:hypothetical protein n=1 Tax=Microbulbifer sp. 2201CG32-9 TaxID=3232309 RepID=UPI00345C4F99
MIKYFAHYDPETFEVAFCPTDIYPEGSIPQPAVEISYSEWQQALTDSCTHYSPDTSTFYKVPPTYTLEETEAHLREAVQEDLDAKAREYGYADLTTAITYAEEDAVSQYQQEGTAFRRWRSLAWEAVNQVLDAWKAGERDLPTADELRNTIPTFTL